MINLKAFAKLQQHYNELKNYHIKDFFNNPLLNSSDNKQSNRAQQFTFKLDELYLDISKNPITQKTVKLFMELAQEIELSKSIKAMFAGDKINFTENRAVLHTALRDYAEDNNLTSLPLADSDYPFQIKEVKDKLDKFVNDFRLGKIKGFSGKPFKSIVNIGIGGSYLGTQMAYNALKEFDDKGFNTDGDTLKVYFISNVDATNLTDILQQIDFDSTLFIIASKTFTTQETLINANSIKRWFIQKVNNQQEKNQNNSNLGNEAIINQAISQHFVALSTNIAEVKKFGIREDWTFAFWDFVGGRYSIWSAIGLPLMLKIGIENFNQFLAGAALMDNHLQEAQLKENLPFLMAITSIWTNNFFDYTCYAILPYDYRLRDFTRYIQQLEMESNGKYINKNSQEVSYNTSPVVFGECGTDSQHSFFQLLHQGTQIIPCDFIGFINSSNPSLANNITNEIDYNLHHNALMANFFAQSEALMLGKNQEAVIKQLSLQNHNQLSSKNLDITQLIPHKVFKGNRPSNTLLFKDLTPYSLGMLCALYEHKIFLQGLIWQINSFDQWGVELGKELATALLADINNDTITNADNSSTINLLEIYKNNKK
ncbi:Glucose-6-phosphate isomerase [Candidatus Hepatincolaceae symbiont of Richtersius coronifer]